MPKTQKWYLMLPCLTLSNIRYVSRVNWSNPGKGVVPSLTHRCSSYWKESLRVALNYGCQLQLLFTIYINLPLPTNRMCHKVNFKRRFMGLNSEFSFSSTVRYIQVGEQSLPYYLSIVLGRIISRAYWRYVKCKQLCPGFELVSPSPVPTMVTITLAWKNYTMNSNIFGLVSLFNGKSTIVGYLM